jgi:hypothetical protein
MLRALLCRDGVGRMRADAEAALAGLSPASPWRTAVMVFQGAAELLDGQADRADAILAHAVEVGRHAAALPAVSTARWPSVACWPSRATPGAGPRR